MTVVLAAAIYLVNLSVPPACAAAATATAAHRSPLHPFLSEHSSSPNSYTITRATNSLSQQKPPAERSGYSYASQFQSIPTGASYADHRGELLNQAASEIELRRRFLGDSDDVNQPSARGASDGNEDSGANESQPEENDSEEAAAAENSENPFMERHHSQLQAMQDLFERRQLAQQQPPPPHQHQHHQQQVPASQELSPLSIGLDTPFGMAPFAGVAHDGPGQGPKMVGGPDGDTSGGMGPLAFGLNPLPHLLGFPGAAPFDGPQRGDQSAHSNSHAASMAQGSETDATSVGGAGGGGGQKIWPKIFRFTDGRINLSDFEKQKKIRLSNKHNAENHIETPPIMFDNRPLKRKSFLILHGGIFSR